MEPEQKIVERVIGLDAHPDSLTAAFLRCQTPASAVHEISFNKVPLSRLSSWAQKHTSPADLIVLEASGSSSYVVRTLVQLGRKALVPESCHVGKPKEAHANNDQTSAVRTGKAFLAGTAKTVWVRDRKTQERRDVLHTHRMSVKRCTQMGNRLRSYLSDHGVRLKPGTRLAQDKTLEAQMQTSKNGRRWNGK